MDYCDICDSEIQLRNFGGVMSAYCPECQKYIDSNPNFKEIEKIKPKTGVGVDYIGFIKCPYCNYEIQEEKNIEYYLDIHLSEEHEDEYRILNSSIEELIEMASGDNFKIAKMALERLEDEEDLMEVYYKSIDWQIRRMVVKKIHNQNELEKILIREKNDQVRNDALSKITSIETLVRVAFKVQEDEKFVNKIEKQKEIIKKYG